ncbi:MAG: Verru_Chthon cassette protein C [Verrucomicrobiales bacterium]
MKTFRPASPRPAAAAFSLIELMVSVAVLSLLMVLVFQMLDETQKTWSRAKGMVSSFKDARDGFEAMNRNVSQATLNTYIGYDMGGTNANIPKKFARKSELHFVCGPASELLEVGEGRTRLTHAIFFQAPLGYQTFEVKSRSSTRKDVYGELDSLLNGWGYFVEYSSDRVNRPPFLSSLSPPVAERFRFRLMEFRQPAEATTIYQYKLEDVRPTQDQKVWEWFRSRKFGIEHPANNDPKGAAGEIRTVRPLADNIIALIISPRLAENDVAASEDNTTRFRFRQPTDIAPDYLYDSRRFHTETDDRATYSRHQVPPVLRVTMIAIDEVDAVRYAAQNPGNSIPKYAPVEKEWFSEVRNYGKDLEKLSEALNAVGIRFRVFTSNIRMREGNFQRL